ncbi:MAG: hypothetical protein Q7S63_03415 [bacterium]|nr:hypothetical protein [bacterium]
MEETGEKLEFLHREDIRTMAKDMARLREEEAKNEREHIVQLQTGKKAQPQQETPLPALQESGTEPGAEKVVLIPPQHKPQSLLEKIVVRVVVASITLFLVANLIALGYYVLSKKGSSQQGPSPEGQQQEQIPAQPALPPESLIHEQNSLLVEYTDASQIPDLLSQSLQETLAPGFTRILLKNGGEYASTQTFLGAFFIFPLQGLGPLLEETTTPFLYATNSKNRLGFVTKVQNAEQAAVLMKSWEPTLERDTTEFFGIMGEKGEGYISFFRTTLYQQVSIRYQTLSNNDFGLVYALLQDRLLVTGSLESMKALIDNISTQ